jgi:hypothetical protein
MQKILNPTAVHAKPNLTGLSMHLCLAAILACVFSTPALAFGGSFDDVWASSAAIGLVGAVLLGLDGLKKQFETRAFFGVLMCVAAGLTVGHSLNSGRNNNYVAEQNNSDAAVAAAPVPIEIIPYSSDVVLYAKKLKLGLANLSQSADEGIDIPGTGTRVYVSCFHDITVHVASAMPLPEKVKVTIEAPNLQPSTRQSEDYASVVGGSQFENTFKMDTRCDLINEAHIVIEGLKFDLQIATPPKDGKVWITINKA